MGVVRISVSCLDCRESESDSGAGSNRNHDMGFLIA